MKVLALGFAAAAASNGVAYAGEMPLGYAPEIEAELAMIDGTGGVTPTGLSRAYVARYDGVASPDGFQPQLRGSDALVIRGAPDGSQPQLRHGEPAVRATGVETRSFDVGDGALGFALGLVLTAALALAVGMSRGGIRTAHS
jgi:hypothetical protein